MNELKPKPITTFVYLYHESDFCIVISNTLFNLATTITNTRVNKAMKKAIIICALAIFVILGGIFLARGMRQQGDIALKDNFTSSFIQEDIDTGEGFHFFRSGNGQYTLWFPKNFYLEKEPPLYISKDHHELMNFFESSYTDSGLERSFQIRY